MKDPQEVQKKKEELAAQLALIQPLVTGPQKMEAALRFGISLETINRYFRGKVCKLSTAQNLYDYFSTQAQLQP